MFSGKIKVPEKPGTYWHRWKYRKEEMKVWKQVEVYEKRGKLYIRDETGDEYTVGKHYGSDWSNSKDKPMEQVGLFKEKEDKKLWEDDQEGTDDIALADQIDDVLEEEK